MRLIFKDKPRRTGWFLLEPIPVGGIEGATAVDHKIGPSAAEADDLPTVDEAQRLAADQRNLDIEDIEVVTTPDDIED
jgi:hypothetical protein